MTADDLPDMSSFEEDFSRIAEEQSKLAAKVNRLCRQVKTSRSCSQADESASRIGALQAAADRKDWARLALEIGDACGLQGQEAVSKLLQAASKAAANPRLMQKAMEQQKVERRRRIHSDLIAVQPVLPFGGPQLSSDSTAVVLGSCGYPELAQLACVSRGSLSAVYSPSVQCGRIIDLMRVKIKKTDDLLRILTFGGRWRRASGLVLPISHVRLRIDVWGEIATAMPGLVHLNINGLPFNFGTRELFTTIIQHFPSLRTFKGAKIPVDLSEDDVLFMLGQLGKLTELEELDLESNLFPASIEALYGLLTALKHLRWLDFRTFDDFPIAVLRNLLQYEKIQNLGLEILDFDRGEYTVQSLTQAFQSSKVRKIQTHDLDLGVDDWRRIKAAVPHMNILVYEQPHDDISE